MKKRQRDKLGLTQIYDLIQAPSNFLIAIKRERISCAFINGDEVRAAYARRAAMIESLKQDPHHKWQDLLAHLAPFQLPSEGASLSLPDIFEVKSFIYHYQKLKAYTMQSKLEEYNLVDLQPLFELLDPELSGLPGFRLSPLFSSRLAELDKKRQQQNQSLKRQRHALLKEAETQLALPHLKESFCLSRSEGELILKLEHSAYFVRTAESVANLSFSLADSQATNAIKAEIAKLNAAIETEEEQVLRQLSHSILSYRKAIDQATNTCAELGWDYMLADFALRHYCCIPLVSSSLSLEGLRNLPLELALKQNGRSYQSLDLSFSATANLITGPNMGGKTSLLKALAHCAELFRRGIPLPASTAHMPFYDYMFYNNEQENDSLSSFGAEVVAFTTALKREGRGLYLLDEFARGTNPSEGEALATAVIKHLALSAHTTIAATHYTKPTRIKGIKHFQIKGIDSSFAPYLKAEGSLENRLRALAKAMDYACLPVHEDSRPPMDAIRIAELLGLPASLLQLAQEGDDAED